jgi:septal ring factor EnvC (AmiA/AmiB activator)
MTATFGLVAVVLAVASLLVVSDRSARTEIRSADVSLASAQHQLAGVRSQLSIVERHLAGARAWRAGVTHSFDSAQSTLASTESALSQAQANVHSQGVDIGKLDACVGAVEQALNQISVGQTSGGLATLRASSSSCAALTEAV